MLFGVVALVMGMFAPASAEDGVTKQVLGQLTGVLRDRINKRLDKQAAAQGQPSDQEESILLPLLSKGVLMGILREELVAVGNSLKEKYKQEGLAYVREAGDVVAERIVHNDKVQSTIGMIKMLVWVVVIYITVVTSLLLILLMKLYKSNRRILELMEKNSAHEEPQP